MTLHPDPITSSIIRLMAGKIQSFLVLFVMVLACHAIGQDTLVLRPGPATGQDCEIRTDMPNTPVGWSPSFCGICWTASSNPMTIRGLIRFDLSIIPSQDNVIKATLSLYCDPNSNHYQLQAGDNASYLSKVLQHWNQDTVTWNMQPNSTMAGAVYLPISTSNTQNYPDIDVTQHVSDMVAHPETNFGWKLQLVTEQLFRSMEFASSNDTAAYYRPKLTVIHQCQLPAPGPVDGPTQVCNGGTGYIYSIAPIPNATSYTWSLPSGAVITSGSGTNTITVSFGGNAVSGTVSVYISTNCSGVSSQLWVNVSTLPAPSGTITGIPVVCAGANDIGYSVAPVANAIAYVWTMPAGASIISGGGTNSIDVSFNGNAVSGDIAVYSNNLCGNGATSSPFYVTVNPIPATPTVSENGETLISSAPIGNQWFYNGMILANDTDQSYLVSPYLLGYYWTQVTLSGCISDTSNHIYFGTTGINNAIGSGLVFFPNPVSKTLVIGISSVHGAIKFIDIYGTGGARIFDTRTDKDKIVVNVENYPAGIYIVKVKSESSTWIGKFCKD